MLFFVFEDALLLSHDFFNSSCSLFLFRCVFDTLLIMLGLAGIPIFLLEGVFGSVRQPRPGVSMESDPALQGKLTLLY